MPSRFIQIHTLTSYPAALLNRDDAGFAKRMPFGGATRLRVSSQCLKRHWRRADGPNALSEIDFEGEHAPLAVRSRLTFQRHVFQPLLDDGEDRETAVQVTLALIDALTGLSAARKKEVKEASQKDDFDPEKYLKTGQVTVLGRPEVEHFLKIAREKIAESDDAAAAAEAVEKHFKGKAGKAAKKNLKELKLGMGLDAALFGRMVTSDVLARCDAAIHVAHAFTVHPAEVEPDYFSAVDDIKAEEGDLGSGHINTTELTSGLYYGYVVVDVPLLVSNLTGCDPAEWDSTDRKLAAEVVRRLVHLVATTSPGAKLGSTAPYANAHMVLVEAGAASPRTLANAFVEPVRNDGKLIAETYGQLAKHLEDLDRNYGAPEGGRAHLALGSHKVLHEHAGEHKPLPELAEWGAERVRS